MNLLNELKNANLQRPAGWPVPVKLVAFAVIFLSTLVLGALADWQAEWATLQAQKDREITLKETFLERKKKAINLDIIKKQLIDTQQTFGALLKQLPSKSEMEDLLSDINQAGLARGLQFDLFRPGAETPTGVFTEQPIAIRVTGSYDDLGKFASDISLLPRIVTLNEISIAPTPGGELSMDAIAKTYRYLDETELAAQNKIAKAGGKK